MNTALEERLNRDLGHNKGPVETESNVLDRISTFLGLGRCNRGVNNVVDLCSVRENGGSGLHILDVKNIISYMQFKDGYISRVHQGNSMPLYGESIAHIPQEIYDMPYGEIVYDTIIKNIVRPVFDLKDGIKYSNTPSAIIGSCFALAAVAMYGFAKMHMDELKSMHEKGIDEVGAKAHIQELVHNLVFDAKTEYNHIIRVVKDNVEKRNDANRRYGVHDTLLGV